MRHAVDSANKLRTPSTWSQTNGTATLNTARLVRNRRTQSGVVLKLHIRLTSSGIWKTRRESSISDLGRRWSRADRWAVFLGRVSPSLLASSRVKTRIFDSLALEAL